MDWWSTFISGVGTAAVFLILAAYARIKQIKNQNEVEKLNLKRQAAAATAEAERAAIENQKLRDENAERKRKVDQDFHFAQEEKISQQKDDLYESMKFRFAEFSSRLDAEVKELKLEGQKRELEHIKCKAENEALRRDRSKLRERLDAIEKRGVS